MSWGLPREYEEALWEAARAVLPRAAVGDRLLVEAISERSRRYTSEREQLREASDESADLAARALFFTVADAPKVQIPLAELNAQGLLPDRTLKVLDAGAGVGAMTLGAAAYGLPLKVDAIDLDGRALEVFAKTASVLGAPLALTTARDDVLGGPQGPYDLVLAGTVVNELSEDQQRAAVSSWMERLTPEGALVIIEPALREQTRALHRLRDASVAQGYHVFAPCTRRGPCPMLLSEEDWCHEDRPSDLPPKAASLSAKTGLRDHGLKFSYLVLRKEPARLVDSDLTAWRVVSRPRKMKGLRECRACSDHGLVKFRLLKRDRSDSNRAFGDAVQGAVLVRAGVEEKIAKGESVLLEHPALTER